MDSRRARTYFGKSLKDLNLEEAALLAAIPKSPEYSPTRNMDKAKMRRDIVLDQMAKYGFITDARGNRRRKAKPIKLADTAYYQSLPKSTAWDYPVEEIRKYLEDKYTTRVAQGGLKVYTTINVDAQKLGTKVVREKLRAYDKDAVLAVRLPEHSGRPRRQSDHRRKRGRPGSDGLQTCGLVRRRI